jgi:hypothetical protein
MPNCAQSQTGDNALVPTRFGAKPTLNSGSPHDPTQRLQSLNLILPPVPKPIGNYVAGVAVGNLLFMSGIGRASPTASRSAARSAATSPFSRVMTRHAWWR